MSPQQVLIDLGFDPKDVQEITLPNGGVGFIGRLLLLGVVAFLASMEITEQVSAHLPLVYHAATAVSVW